MMDGEVYDDQTLVDYDTSDYIDCDGCGSQSFGRGYTFLRDEQQGVYMAFCECCAEGGGALL